MLWGWNNSQWLKRTQVSRIMIFNEITLALLYNNIILKLVPLDQWKSKIKIFNADRSTTVNTDNCYQRATNEDKTLSVNLDINKWTHNCRMDD